MKRKEKKERKEGFLYKDKVIFLWTYISFHKSFQQFSAFFTLFSQPYFCLTGPFNYISLSESLPNWPRSGEQRAQKLKSYLVEAQNLNVLLLEPGVGQYTAIQAMLTARYFFLVYFYTSGPFTCIFSKPLPIFPVFAVAYTWFLCRPAE